MSELLRERMFDDGCEGRTFLQKGVMPENGIDFDQLPRSVQARGQGLHVIERHELVLADGNQRCRRVHLRRVHFVQVDRLAQRKGYDSARYFCT